MAVVEANNNNKRLRCINARCSLDDKSGIDTNCRCCCLRVAADNWQINKWQTFKLSQTLPNEFIKTTMQAAISTSQQSINKLKLKSSKPTTSNRRFFKSKTRNKQALSAVTIIIMIVQQSLAFDQMSNLVPLMNADNGVMVVDGDVKPHTFEAPTRNDAFFAGHFALPQFRPQQATRAPQLPTNMLKNLFVNSVRTLPLASAFRAKYSPTATATATATNSPLSIPQTSSPPPPTSAARVWSFLFPSANTSSAHRNLQPNNTKQINLSAPYDRPSSSTTFENTNKGDGEKLIEAADESAESAAIDSQPTADYYFYSPTDSANNEQHAQLTNTKSSNMGLFGTKADNLQFKHQTHGHSSQPMPTNTNRDEEINEQQATIIQQPSAHQTSEFVGDEEDTSTVDPEAEFTINKQQQLVSNHANAVDEAKPDTPTDGFTVGVVDEARAIPQLPIKYDDNSNLQAPPEGYYDDYFKLSQQQQQTAGGTQQPFEFAESATPNAAEVLTTPCYDGLSSSSPLTQTNVKNTLNDDSKSTARRHLPSSSPLSNGNSTLSDFYSSQLTTKPAVDLMDNEANAGLANELPSLSASEPTTTPSTKRARELRMQPATSQPPSSANVKLILANSNGRQSPITYTSVDSNASLDRSRADSPRHTFVDKEMNERPMDGYADEHSANVDAQSSMHELNNEGGDNVTPVVDIERTQQKLQIKRDDFSTNERALRAGQPGQSQASSRSKSTQMLGSTNDNNINDKQSQSNDNEGSFKKLASKVSKLRNSNPEVDKNELMNELLVALDKVKAAIYKLQPLTARMNAVYRKSVTSNSRDIIMDANKGTYAKRYPPGDYDNSYDRIQPSDLPTSSAANTVNKRRRQVALTRGDNEDTVNEESIQFPVYVRPPSSPLAVNQSTFASRFGGDNSSLSTFGDDFNDFHSDDNEDELTNDYNGEEVVSNSMQLFPITATGIGRRLSNGSIDAELSVDSAVNGSSPNLRDSFERRLGSLAIDDQQATIQLTGSGGNRDDASSSPLFGYRITIFPSLTSSNIDEADSEDGNSGEDLMATSESLITPSITFVGKSSPDLKGLASNIREVNEQDLSENNDQDSNNHDDDGDEDDSESNKNLDSSIASESKKKSTSVEKEGEAEKKKKKEAKEGKKKEGEKKEAKKNSKKNKKKAESETKKKKEYKKVKHKKELVSSEKKALHRDKKIKAHDRGAKKEKALKERTQIEFFEREQIVDDEHEKAKKSSSKASWESGMEKKKTSSDESKKKKKKKKHDDSMAAGSKQYAQYERPPDVSGQLAIGVTTDKHQLAEVLEPMSSEKSESSKGGGGSASSSKHLHKKEEAKLKKSHKFEKKNKHSKGKKFKGWREKGYKIITETEFIDRGSLHDSAYKKRDKGGSMHQKKKKLHSMSEGQEGKAMEKKKKKSAKEEAKKESKSKEKKDMSKKMSEKKAADGKKKKSSKKAKKGYDKEDEHAVAASQELELGVETAKSVTLSTAKPNIVSIPNATLPIKSINSNRVQRAVHAHLNQVLGQTKVASQTLEGKNVTTHTKPAVGEVLLHYYEAENGNNKSAPLLSDLPTGDLSLNSTRNFNYDDVADNQQLLHFLSLDTNNNIIGINGNSKTINNELQTAKIVTNKPLQHMDVNVMQIVDKAYHRQEPLMSQHGFDDKKNFGADEVGQSSTLEQVKSKLFKLATKMSNENRVRDFKLQSLDDKLSNKLEFDSFGPQAFLSHHNQQQQQHPLILPDFEVSMQQQQQSTATTLPFVPQDHQQQQQQQPQQQQQKPFFNKPNAVLTQLSSSQTLLPIQQQIFPEHMRFHQTNLADPILSNAFVRRRGEGEKIQGEMF